MQIEWRKSVGTQMAHQLGKKVRGKFGKLFIKIIKNNGLEMV